MAEERVDQLPEPLTQPFVQLLLSIADDKFILGHRNADWTGLAPLLEEDIAFSSLAQDELAHATALYQMIAGLLGTSADRLAFGRPPEEYRCAEIVERADQFNWAVALCRNFFCDHCDRLRLGRLAASRYTPIAQLAGRLAAEEQIHVEHSDSWLTRLGRSGGEAKARLQEALDTLTPLTATLFEAPEGIAQLEAVGIYPATTPALCEHWSEEVRHVAQEAGLTLLLPPPTPAPGGRHGIHGDNFRTLLDELTEVYRIEPEATW